MYFAYNIDPTDPGFPQYIQELKRTNPDHPDYQQFLRDSGQVTRETEHLGESLEDLDDEKWAKEMLQLSQDEDEPELTDDELIEQFANEPPHLLFKTD